MHGMSGISAEQRLSQPRPHQSVRLDGLNPMTQTSGHISISYPQGLSLWRRQGRAQSQRPPRLCPHRGRRAGQRRRRLHRQPRHRRSAYYRQKASAGNRRQGARRRHQRRQRQLRRRSGRPGCGPRHLRGRRPALRLPAGGGLSLLHRRHRRSAAGRKAHRRPARPGRRPGRRIRPLPAGRPGHPDHRHGGEDRLRAAGNRRERGAGSPPSARARA